MSVRVAHNDADPIGVLNVYITIARAFDNEDGDVAGGLARLAGAQLVTLGKLRHLRQSLDFVAVIEEAEGVLMLQYGIHAHQAFEVLFEYGRANGLSLREVATQVVRNRRL